MAIRNPVLFGLKVDFNFTDTLSKSQCLENLGLRIADLDVIRGVSGIGVSKNDLQNVSGLNVNLTRYIDRLNSDTSLYAGIINRLAGYSTTTQGNFEAYGPVSGGAVRYQYIPNDKGSGLTPADLKYGDISTSRVSSWSSATSDETDTEQPISYGASVQVKRTLRIGQKTNFEPPVLDSLINVLDVPEPIRFPTEVATDIIEVTVNGQSRYMYAMRGIPIVFVTAFKNIALDLEINIISSGNPIYTIQDTDLQEQEIKSIPTLSGNLSRLRYNGPTFRERFVKIYYPPNDVLGITARSLNIIELPPVKFLALQSIFLDDNLIADFPDFTTINYEYNAQDPTIPPTSTLQTIDLRTNPLSLSEFPELTRFGTAVVERLPKTLRSLELRNTFFAETTFKNIEQSLAIKASVAEFNAVTCHPTDTQAFTFNIPTRTDSNAISNISGIFYDKTTFAEQDTTYRYVYVKNVKVLKSGSLFGGVEPPQDYEGEDFLNLVQNTYTTSYRDYFDVIDLSTRTPFLQTYSHPQSGNKRIYKTSLTATPNPDLVTYNVSDEITPRVELRSILTYNISDMRFTKLNNIFISPQNYLGPNEISTLRNFNVGSNTSLTEIDNGINFTKMADIRSINISQTRLPIPVGLQGNTNLVSISCSNVTFPARNTSPPSPYTQLHPSGGYINPATGDGNPSNLNNVLFTTQYPLTFGEYVFTGCNSLTSLSFYSSTLGGMIPKMTGNDSLSSIDLRGCNNVEGGRPPNLTENNGFHGRRFVMWDNTFQDCANSISAIRLGGTNLGRNIGVFNPATLQYTEAEFQGSTFALPNLSELRINSGGKYLRGAFFSISGCPRLDFLQSVNSGWGLDLPDGANLPSFASNNSLRIVELYGNNFSGTLTLNNLPNLESISLQNNIIEQFGVYSNLPKLKTINLGNNGTLTGSLPNLDESPLIQTLAFSNCSLTSYTSGSIVNASKLRSLDLSNNNLNQSSVDTLLDDCILNYNNAPRSGVVINLSGTNAPPSTIITNIPTVNTTTQQLVVDVEQPPAQTDPVYQDNYTQVYEYDDVRTSNPNDKFYSRQSEYTVTIPGQGNDPDVDVTLTGTQVLPTSAGVGLPIEEDGGTAQVQAADGQIDLDANGDVIITTPPITIPRVFEIFSKQSTAEQLSNGIPDGSSTSAGPSLDIRDGVDPGNSNVSYETKIFIDGFDFTSNVTIDFANDKITFPDDGEGGGYPETGTTITFQVITTIRETRQEISGGVVTVQTLRSLGWIVRTA